MRPRYLAAAVVALLVTMAYAQGRAEGAALSIASFNVLVGSFGWLLFARTEGG